MTHHKSKSTTPFSIRLMARERDFLVKQANGKPVAKYVREKLFHANDNDLVLDMASKQRLLAEILARLGRSDIAKSLRELADASRIGALAMTPESEAQIAQALVELEEIHALLMKALNVKEG